jgi:subtilisin family serine protease
MKTISFALLTGLLFLSNLICLKSQTSYTHQRYADAYLGNVVHFSLKPELRNIDFASNTALQQLLNRFNAAQPEKRFPKAVKPEKPFNKQGERLADLSLHFSIRFGNANDPIKVVDALRKTGLASIVEPHFLPRLCYVPNDDSIGVQYALQKIAAFAAWDISRGDTNTIVGITDTGIDPNHPDLSSNIARNWADPINGIDDDNDGYTDNFIGWDTC